MSPGSKATGERGACGPEVIALLRMRTPVKVVVGIAVVGLAIQLVRFEQTNPPVESDIHAPADVDQLLRRACYDCHSHETKWPWYSQVAPVSWLVTRDTNEGRKHLNFSRWGSYSLERQQKKLKEIAEEVGEGEMPMAIYLPMHPEAKFSAAEKERLVNWAKTSTPTTPSSPEPAHAE